MTLNVLTYNNYTIILNYMAHISSDINLQLIPGLRGTSVTHTITVFIRHKASLLRDKKESSLRHSVIKAQDGIIASLAQVSLRQFRRQML